MHPFSHAFLKKYKAVISDFDGTLVDKSLEFTPEAEKFVKYIISHNLHFSIASGRPFFGIVESVCKKLNLGDYQIVSGGSLIVNPKTKEHVWIKQFDQNLARELITKLQEAKGNFSVETTDAVYTKDNLEKKQYGPGVWFKNLDDLDYSQINKIVILPIDTPQEVMDQIHVIVDSYKDKLHAVNANSPAGPAYDLTPSSASKHFATLELVKLLKIEKKDTIGIGDSYNDYPLLTACGFKVAIEGAPKELLQIADLVISREKLFSSAGQ